MPLPVDPHGDGAPDPLVVEWRERVVEAEVEDVQPGARLEREADVVVDRGDAGRVEVVDAVDGRRPRARPGASAAPARQRTITRSLRAGAPQYASLRARLISEPRFQLSSRYGPVPLTSVTIAWVPAVAGSMCDSSQPCR